MYFIDVQGTLIDDLNRLPIDGAIPFIDHLNYNNIPYMVVTNNTKEPSDDFWKYLWSIGFQIPKNNYLDPLMILDEVLTDRQILAFGNEQFKKVLQSKGYLADSREPQSVLIGVSKDYSAKDFSEMIEALLNGAKLFGMHYSAIYSKNGNRYAGVGAILEMLKTATSSHYEIIGKPSKLFYLTALKKIRTNYDSSIDFKNITMISDDFKGDLVGIQKLGAKTVFVLSGKYKTEQEIKAFVNDVHRPNKILKSINELSY
jgi:NagD protein